MKKRKIACLGVLGVFLLAFLPFLASGEPMEQVWNFPCYIIDLGGGGQYNINLSTGDHYYELRKPVMPVVMPEEGVNIYEVTLAGDGQNNYLYLADGQYINLILPEGGGGQYRIIYGGSSSGSGLTGLLTILLPEGGGGMGGSFGLFVIPKGGGGQYMVKVIPLGGL